MQTLLNNIHISISTEDGELLKVQTISALKDKFSFLSKANSYYRVCIEKTNIYWGSREPVYVKVKIMSDNMDEPNISEAVKSQDVGAVSSKIDRIIMKAEALIRTQESDLVREESSANRQMKFVSYYYYIALLQIVVVVGLGLYQIFAFKNFLKNKE